MPSGGNVRDAPELARQPEAVPQSGWPLAGPEVLRADAPPSARDIRDALVTKAGDLFLLTDLEGNIPPDNPNGFGLYHRDTRMLSGFELVVQGLRPTILLSTTHAHFLSEQVLTNPNLSCNDGREAQEQTIEIRRYRRLLESGARERLVFENFNSFPLPLLVGFRLAVDFADMFEVRGLVAHRALGQRQPVQREPGRLTFRYRGRDGVSCSTRIELDPEPHRIDDGFVGYSLELPAHGSRALSIRIDVRIGDEPVRPRPARPVPAFRADQTPIHTSDALFDQVLRQAGQDLEALLSGDGSFPAAGVPWYATLFGRDSLLTALLVLWRAPALARGTLRLLAKHQGQRDDPWRDEEPGKILHELRRGELARLGEIPFAPYYGSVDATPLWVMLLHDYYRTTGDLELVRELRVPLDRALAWCERYGDLDGDGLVEYARRSASGLVHQGWKDSWNGILHADGAPPPPPIALVEVQGYVFAALHGAAELYRALGDALQAVRLEREAARVQNAFEERFWWAEEGTYYLALDGEKRPVAQVTSNPGHALFSGIVRPERAPSVARRLVTDDLFSGWGVRTLSTRAKSYNPTGYHLGSVWPHDNALAVLGLKRYGEEDRALVIIEGLLAAARHFPLFRLPELFCGFARSAFGTPVRYPVACSPQAWAAAAPSAFVQAMLGIRLHGATREVRIIRPRLPRWLHWMRVEALSVGDAQVDLRYERVGDHTAVDVMAIRGDARVTFLDRWAP